MNYWNSPFISNKSFRHGKLPINLFYRPVLPVRMRMRRKNGLSTWSNKFALLRERQLFKWMLSHVVDTLQDARNGDMKIQICFRIIVIRIIVRKCMLIDSQDNLIWHNRLLVYPFKETFSDRFNTILPFLNDLEINLIVEYSSHSTKSVRASTEPISGTSADPSSNTSRARQVEPYLPNKPFSSEGSTKHIHFPFP